VMHSKSSAGPAHATPSETAAETAGAVRRFAHDVVSPLMSVMALSEVLLLESRNDARLNEDLRRIHDAAEEALTMVRTLSVQVTSDQAGGGH
jgi:hypothetical protein